MGNRRDVQVAHALNDLVKDAFHIDIWVFGIPYAHIVAVEVDRVQLTDAIRETRRIEIRLDSADAENEVGRLNHLPHTCIGAISSIDTAEILVRLIHCALAHGCDKGRQARNLDQLLHLFQGTVTDGTSINQDDRVLGCVEILENHVDDIILLLGIVLG